MANTPINEQVQDLVFDLDIATASTSANTTQNNTSGNLFIYGGDVRIFDNAGEITEFTRGDRFEVNIQANEKNQISNSPIDARTLREMLKHPQFKGFMLLNGTNTKITVTHTPVNAAVNVAPYKVHITLFGRVGEV